MHQGREAPDGRIKMWEIKLCVICTRMIILNDERFQKIYVKGFKDFAYAHQECPPLRFFGTAIE